MDLLMQKIYEVVEANQSIFTDAGLEPIRTMDIYRDQPLSPGMFEFFETPALFIDYAITNWRGRRGNFQGDGKLDVHVVTDSPFGETGNIFTNKAEGLKKTFYYKKVRQLLDNLESQNTGKLKRTDERPVDTGVITYHILGYVFDYSDREEYNAPTVLAGDDSEVDITGKQLVEKLP